MAKLLKYMHTTISKFFLHVLQNQFSRIQNYSYDPDVFNPRRKNRFKQADELGLHLWFQFLYLIDILI